MMDIQMEGRRRAGERANERAEDVVLAVDRYEQVIFRALHRLAELEQLTGAASSGAATREARGLERSVLEAQTRIDELVGLRYPA